jgi:hypothetical protein
MQLGPAPLDVGALPWPSDALLGPDGKLQIAGTFPFSASNGDNLTQLALTLSELDGFGTTTSIFFPLSGDVTVDEGATATVVDLDDPSAPPLAYPLYYRAPYQQLVAMVPNGTALTERHAYGCFVTSGVPALRPSAEMQDAMRGQGPLATQGAWLKLAAYLQAQGLSPVAATAFTTQRLTTWVPKVLADLDAMPPKAHVTRVFKSAADLDLIYGGPAANLRPGRPPSGGVYHGGVAFVVEGTFDVPHYLSATPGLLGLFDDAMTVRSVDHVPFLLTLPTVTAGASYAGTPLLIFQHGINDDRKAVLEVSTSFASAGYAVLGIDELWHGSRLPANVDRVVNLSPQVATPDGIGDPAPASAVQWFFDINGDRAHGVEPLDPRYMRDNLRQAVIDLMQEVRLARGGDFSEVAAQDPALASLTLDGSRLVYMSESFGSILGAPVLALDPALPAAVLDVGGGGILLDLVAHSAAFGDALQPFVSGAFDLDLDIDHPDTLPIKAQMSLSLLQTVLETGDGLALTAQRDRTQPKQLLFLEAFHDETVPNPATEALANIWGATEVTLSQRSHATQIITFPTVSAPYSAAPELHALVQLDPATHGMFTTQQGQQLYQIDDTGSPPFMRLDTPVQVNNPIELAHALALGFASSFRASGVPTVPDSH